MDNTNVIVVPEKRTTIDRIRNNMNTFKDKLKNAYQEKVVDTGISDNIDKFIDQKAKITKGVVTAVGAVATVVLLIVPADGTLGETCSALLTPGLLGLISASAEIEKKAKNTVKGFLEKKVIKIDKANDNVEVYDDQGKVMTDVIDLINNVKTMDKSFTKGAAA